MAPRVPLRAVLVTHQHRRFGGGHNSGSAVHADRARRIAPWAIEPSIGSCGIVFDTRYVRKYMDVVERSVVSQSDMKQMFNALTALKKGDSSVRLPVDWTGLQGKIADAF